MEKLFLTTDGVEIEIDTPTIAREMPMKIKR
jgi:hypothetical protein